MVAINEISVSADGREQSLCDRGVRCVENLIFTGPGADGIWFTDDDVQSTFGGNSIIYCGYCYDFETENYYVRNRTYNPVLGRWIQRDPIEYEGGINLYGYVGSSPVGNLDPSGRLVRAFIYASVEITAGLGGEILVGAAADECGNSAQFMIVSQRLGANVGIDFANGGLFSGCVRDFINEGITGVDLAVSGDIGLPIVGGTVSGTVGLGGAGSGVAGGLGTGIKVGASVGLDEVVPLGRPDVGHPCPCRKRKCPTSSSSSDYYVPPGLQNYTGGPGFMFGQP